MPPPPVPEPMYAEPVLPPPPVAAAPPAPINFGPPSPVPNPEPGMAPAPMGGVTGLPAKVAPPPTLAEAEETFAADKAARWTDRERQIGQDIRRDYQAPDLESIEDPLERAQVKAADIAARAKMAETQALQLRGERMAEMAKIEKVQQEEALKEKERVLAEQKQDQEELQRTIREGPKRSGGQWAGLILGALADVVGSTIAGREPNTMGLIDRFMQQTEATWKRQVQAAREEVTAGGSELDRLTEEARLQAQQMATQKAAIAAELARSLEEKASHAGTEIEKLNAMNAAEVVRRQGLQQEAVAQRAAQDRALSLAERNMKLRKLGADVVKTEAEAAKLSRQARGGGQPVDTSLNVRDATGVYIPNTDIKLSDFGKGGEKRAAKANEVVTDAYGFLQSVNEVQAMLEDYGRRGLMESSAFTQSDEFRALEAAHKLAVNKLAKMIAGPGLATTAQDVASAEKLLALPSGWWERADGAKIAAATLKRKMEDEMRLRLNPFLNTKAQERLISQARTRSISKRDATNRFAARAVEVAKDSDADVKDRLAAVQAIKARAREQADNQGDEGAWVYTAGEELAELAGDLGSDPASKKVAAEVHELLRDIRDKLKRRNLVAKRPKSKGIGTRFGAQEYIDGPVEPRRTREDALIEIVDDAIGQER